MAAAKDKMSYDETTDGMENAQTPAQGRYAPTSQTPYRFTNDEIRVLRQCNRESFYQRSLPLSSLLGLGTYFSVKSGYLKGHARFGPAPKVIMAATLGYFVGKFSYQTKCAEKIMQLPNSPIGEMLRKRKRQGGRFQDTLSMESGFSSLSSFTNMNPSDTYSDVGPNREIDMERPLNEGLDDSFRPTLDSPILEEELLPPPGTQTSPTTYEELRRKNREEYEHKKTKQFRGVTGQEDVPSAIRQQPYPHDTTPHPPASWSREKNKYGDVWED